MTAKANAAGIYVSRLLAGSFYQNRGKLLDITMNKNCGAVYQI